MDPLRLALIAFGVCLLVGIYLWERSRSNRGQDINGDDQPQAEDRRDIRQEPVFDRPEPAVPEAVQKGNDIRTPQATDMPLASTVEPGTQPQPASAGTNNSRANFMPIVNVVAKQPGFFSGNRIVEAFGNVDLKYGEMDIYHYYGPDQEDAGVWFSVANLVKPGSFPNAAMDRFETPGLTLFMLPQEVDDPCTAFDKMIDVAFHLADELDGAVSTGKQETLTAEELERMRRQLSDTFAMLS